MTERTQLTLNNFFIYNETFGRDEGKVMIKWCFFGSSLMHSFCFSIVLHFFYVSGGRKSYVLFSFKK